MNDMPVFKAVELPHVPSEGMYTTKQCRYGLMKWFTADYGVGAFLRDMGEYFEGEVAIFRRLLRVGDVIVTAGGNIGAHVVPLSQIVGYHGRVITFEPQAQCRELLEVNVRVNGCTNVEVHAEALGHEFATASLPSIDYSIPNNFGGLNLIMNGPVPVRVIPLDSLELDALHMLMLDVEGFEEAALRGARETIMRHRPYLYVEIDKEDKREPLLAYMKHELHYEVLFHTPDAFNPENFAGATANPYGPMRSIMCLGIPR